MADRPKDYIIENDWLLDDWYDKKIKELEQKKEGQDKENREYRRQQFRMARKAGQKTGRGSKKSTQSFTFERS